MGSRSKKKPRNVPLEQALAAIVKELQAMHTVVSALVRLQGEANVQAELDRMATERAPK